MHNFLRVKKILVIKLRHIGDVLLTVPVFRALREAFPGSIITALVNKGTEDVLTGNPLLNEVLTFDRNIKKLPSLKRYLKEKDFLGEVRARGFDMTIDLTSGDRAAVISLVSGARYRIGPVTSKGFIGKKYFYTHLAQPVGKRHTVLRDLDVISQFGIKTSNFSVDFHVPEKDRSHIKKILSEKGVKEGSTIVHVHPTSRWLFKCWRDEAMAEIIKWLAGRGLTVIVTSSPEKREIEKTKRIISLVAELTPPHILPGETGGVLDLSGKTTIKQLAAISEVSALFLGVDSAPMHIAAAVGTPVIALFGPSGAFDWGPWDNNCSNLMSVGCLGKNNRLQPEGQDKEGKPADQFMSPYGKQNGIQTLGRHTVIQRDWDCIPCGRDGCGGSKVSKCLEDITSEEIKAVLADKLMG